MTNLMTDRSENCDITKIFYTYWKDTEESEATKFKRKYPISLKITKIVTETEFEKWMKDIGVDDYKVFTVDAYTMQSSIIKRIVQTAYFKNENDAALLTLKFL